MTSQGSLRPRPGNGRADPGRLPAAVVDPAGHRGYRPAMEQRAREDIAAAAAAHRELGPDYDGAVAESLIERISEEIDKRVDARLGARNQAPRRRADPAVLERHRTYWKGVAVGAGVVGGPLALVAVTHGGRPIAPAGFALGTFALWAVLAVLYFVTTWVHNKHGGRD
jgi:anti-sigma-K factor RskA